MKKILTSLALLLIGILCYGQSKGITPMHKIFQQLADSTIIIEYSSQSSNPPSYKIISKSNDTVNAFTYLPSDTTIKNFTKWPTGMPKVLGMVLSIHKTSFNTMPANINIFFSIVPLSSDTTKKMWGNITKFKPWQLVDDKSYPSCPPGKNYAVATDGLYSIMHLITKKEIKTLIFYDPKYYEEQCPGNTNRITIVAIGRLFYEKIPFKN